jgi:hypothetical protein
MTRNGNGVLGLTPPRGGNRDITGTYARRMNLARQRLIAAGRPTSSLTQAEVEAEAQQYEQERSGKNGELARDKAAYARADAFLRQLRESGPGDIIGPDSDGQYWQVSDDGETIREVPAP